MRSPLSLLATAALGFSGLLIFAVATSSVSACSDDPPAAAPANDAGPDGPAPLSAEAEGFVRDFCAVNEPCCASLKGQGNTCVTETTAFARGKAYDATKAKACIDALKVDAKTAAYCGQGPSITTCGGVFKNAGSKNANEACKTNADCSNGGAPDADGLCLGAGDKAKCRQVKHGKEGDACVGTRAAGKTDELVTIPDGATSLCFISDGLVCDSKSSKCVKRGEVGATCSPSSLGACLDTAFCSRNTEQCTARVGADAPCEDADQCLAGFTCGNDGEGNGVCLALAREGGACIRGDECDPAASLVCDNNTTKCIVDTNVYEQTCSGASALLR